MLRQLILVCLCVIPLQLFAEWQPFTINYTVKDGLPSSECYYVLTDKRGYIWIATDYGISCYNGRKFTNYVNELREKSIILMTCDKQNRIWFISANGVFGYISKGKVHYPKASEKFKNRLNVQESVTSMNYDEKGNLVIGTSSGFFKVSKKQRFSSFYSLKKNGIENRNVGMAWKLGKNRCVTGWNNSIADFALPLGQRVKQKEIDIYLYGNRLNQVVRFKDKNPTASTVYFNILFSRNGKKYLVYLNQLIEVTKAKKRVRFLEDRLHFLFEDHDQNLFITTITNGVYFYKKGNLNQSYVRLLPGEYIGSMTQDLNGGYWFTSTKNGLFHVPHLEFCIHTDYQDKPINRLRKIDDKLFAIADNGQLMTTPDDDPAFQFDLYPTLLAYRQNQFELLKYKDRYFYLSDLSGFIDKAFQNIDFIQHEKNNINVILAAGVVDDKSDFYAINKLEFYKVIGNKVHFLKVNPERGTALFFSKKYKLLLGTKKGLYRYNRKTGQLTPFQYWRFGKEEITKIGETQDGNLIVATKDKGVFCEQSDKWIHLTQKNGLISNFCKDFVVTDDNWIILKLQGGVNYLSLQRPGEIFDLAASNGGWLNEEVKCIEVKNGLLYLGYTNGISRIPLSLLRQKRVELPIVLSKVEYKGKTTTAHYFPFEDNTLRFYIDVLKYNEEQENDYTYYLKGLDQKSKEGNSEYLEYTNLPAGDYALLVSTRDENGKLRPYKKLIAFTIKTPFWQTWWFITLCFIAAVSLITGIIVWRIRILNKREAKRNELLRQIAESQVVALRAQMNPHFIFNAINSIQDFVLQNETEDAYSYLSKFARLIRLVMHQSNNNFLSLEQEIDWLKIYMELEQLRFKGKFEFELVVDPELEMDLQIPNMLIQPHLENAIWHGIMPLRGKRSGKVRLAFLSDGESLRVEIEDNGVGRENALEKKGHNSSGIRLVNDRLERLSKLENIEFRHEIIDVINDKGEVSGTKVILHVDQLA